MLSYYVSAMQRIQKRLTARRIVSLFVSTVEYILVTCASHMHVANLGLSEILTSLKDSRSLIPNG
jgi:hypothetical protein